MEEKENSVSKEEGTNIKNLEKYVIKTVKRKEKESHDFDFRCILDSMLYGYILKKKFFIVKYFEINMLRRHKECNDPSTLHIKYS